jgi:hypothetical protein
MSSARLTPADIPAAELSLGDSGRRLATVLLSAGVLLIAASWPLAGGAERFWQSYFIAFCFYLSLSLGALFFVLLHHLVGASWSVVVRRVAEVFAANLLLVAVLFAPLAAGGTGVLGCNPTGHVPASAAWFLKGDFFFARCGLYLGIWAALAIVYWRRSTAQDESGDVALTLRNRRWSGLGMVVYGFSVALGGFDLLMALSPPWQSTIFGVCFFAGCAVGFLALLPLSLMALQSAGRLKSVVTTEHYHDIGKLLFAFVFFWSYVTFSQYMLIWYADMPEETAWFLRRGSPEAGAWNTVAYVLLFGHWMIPFVALLSREVKRRKALLAFWCVWLLALHYLDLYWLAMPTWHEHTVPLNLADAACVLGMGAVYLAGALTLARGKALLPVKDPQLAESLSFENY